MKFSRELLYEFITLRKAKIEGGGILPSMDAQVRYVELYDFFTGTTLYLTMQIIDVLVDDFDRVQNLLDESIKREDDLEDRLQDAQWAAMGDDL